MADEQQIVSHTHIKVGGVDLPDLVRSQLLEASIDQHVHLPAMFTLRFHDTGMKLLDEGPLNLVSEVEIQSRAADGKLVKLIAGEITALEPDFGEGMIAELTVRGYDKSHQLYRECKSKTFQNVKDSDLATQIAKEAGLKTEIDTTATVYDHIYQHNQSDLEFLRYRAWRIGYECFVADGKLHFHKPKMGEPSATIAWGQDLVTFRPRLTLAEQVEEVQIKGWDVQKKAPTIGVAKNGQLYPETQEQDGKAWSKKLGGMSRLTIVDQPVTSQAEADLMAAARLDELSGAFIEAEGEAFRRPDIQAGSVVKIEGLGKRLSGNYLVTRANHIYTDAGLTTYFTVSGSRLGLLAEQLHHESPMDRWPGVVPAIVTNTDDPNGWGRVKVKYPWMSDEEESNWTRVLGIGAGPECGFTVIPAVEDEVMVAFQHGDFNTPIVLGGVWNGEYALPGQVAGAPEGEKPLVRSWTSRTGHRITIFDNADNKVEIETKGGHLFTLDDVEKEISVKSTGMITMKADSEVQIEASQDLTLKAGGNMQFEAQGNLQVDAMGNVQMAATGNLQMEATGNASLQSSSLAAVKAPQISLG